MPNFKMRFISVKNGYQILHSKLNILYVAYLPFCIAISFAIHIVTLHMCSTVRHDLSGSMNHVFSHKLCKHVVKTTTVLNIKTV